MKLRIKGNSIRLRLTQAEVIEIGQGRQVQEFVPFGSHFPSFSYVLSGSADASKTEVCFQGHTISVMLPQAQAQQWAASDQISIEEKKIFDNGDELYILIEKDFQCLHKRPDEDESDHFPNPGMDISFI